MSTRREKSVECKSPSKDELLASIHPNMRLTKGTLKRIYGYGLTDATFPDKAFAALEAAGCPKARQYYCDWVKAYEAAYEAEMKPVAAWYRRECEKEYAQRQTGGEKVRTADVEMELLKQKRQLLMQKLRRLTGG